MLAELPIEKPSVNLPLKGMPPNDLNPSAEVGGERIEVQLQAITGEYGETIPCQHFHKCMYNGMGRGLSARPNFEHGDNFGARVDSEPNPESVSALTGLGAKLIQFA